MRRLIVICAILLGMTALAYSAYASPWNEPLGQSASGMLESQGTVTPTPLTGSPTPTSMPTATPVADTATLQVLLQRLFGYPYPGAPTLQTQIYVGKLPEKLSTDIPVPDGSRVIGSVVRGEESVQVVLDAPQPPDGVLDFYRRQMSAMGWSAPDQSAAPSGGFVPSGLGSALIFCQSRTGPSLSVNASTDRGQPTDVRLDLNTNKTQGYPCSQEPGAGPLNDQLIPRLVAPTGSQQIESGSGGSSTRSSYTTATYATDQNASALASFYGDQLTQAGWTKLDSGQSGQIAWTTWDLRDKDGTSWNGLFFALDLPGTPSRRFVYARVDMQ